MTRLPSILSLMSPPEAKPLDSFISPHASGQLPFSTPETSFNADNTLPPISDCASPDNATMRVLPSPPVSPWPNKSFKEQIGGKRNGIVGDESVMARDPVLYPEGHTQAGIPTDQPLFPLEPTMAIAEEIVSQHMAMHMAEFDHKINRPTRDEYLFALSCIPNIGRSYNRNPGAYMKRTREETEDQYWKAKRICAKPGTKALSHVNIAPALAPKAPKRAIKAVSSGNPLPRVKRTPKSSPIGKLQAYSPKGRSQTPEIRVPGTKRPEDVDYNSLPDYSPSTETLPKGNPKCLKADWPSNNILNLSNDPDRHLLHEAELNLAGTLRLSCATYLCSKRRIFEGRLHALRIGKEFRKTDAQQACKIDVNKASKLWTAYDKVGWFSKGYFQQWL